MFVSVLCPTPRPTYLSLSLSIISSFSMRQNWDRNHSFLLSSWPFVLDVGFLFQDTLLLLAHRGESKSTEPPSSVGLAPARCCSQRGRGCTHLLGEEKPTPDGMGLLDQRVEGPAPRGPEAKLRLSRRPHPPVLPPVTVVDGAAPVPLQVGQLSPPSLEVERMMGTFAQSKLVNRFPGKFVRQQSSPV